MRLIFFAILLIYSGFYTINSQNTTKFKLQNGDLIFQESCTGEMGGAIKDVTTSANNFSFTHVGIVYINSEDSIFVLEATHPKVALAPIDEYLNRPHLDCCPLSVVGRLKESYQTLIPDALNYGFKLIGKEYDDAFMLGNDQYYCSELVYEIFKKANNGKDLFPLNVMTFKSSITGQFSEGWIKHFKILGIPIPEGEMGINPGGMSRSEILDLVFTLPPDFF